MNILEMALSLELDLEKYYKEQALLNEGNQLNTIFLMLAQEENNHAKLLINKRDNLSYDLEDSNLLAHSNKLFKEMKDYKHDIKDIPSQLDSYRMALDKEKQSSTFYENLLKDIQDNNSKTIFTFLLKQENDHCKILEDIILLLTRPEEWVESADFGLREEY